MTSTITNYSSNIDVGFPIPGADNDTAGFRNNFSAIQNGLITAASEITDLQTIQNGIINNINNSSNPTDFNGSSVTATTVNSFNLNNSNAISTLNLSASGNITANGVFYGDGSGLTNIKLSNLNLNHITNVSVNPSSTITNITNVTNNTVLSNNSLQTYNVQVNNASVTLDYNNGQYQIVTIDTSGYNATTIYTTGWPQSGKYAPLFIEVNFKNTPLGPLRLEARSSCTTYGSTSTTVVIDDSYAGIAFGTNAISKGWAVYNTSTITIGTPILTTIQSIVSKKQITVLPGYNFIQGNTYYFGPPVSSGLPYTIAFNTLTSQLLKTEDRIPTINGVPSDSYVTGTTVVAQLYSYDSGSHIFFNKLDVYSNSTST
jgi:hypothetical protein